MHRCDNVKTMRHIALIAIAALYLGSAVAQVCAMSFPVIGSGDKTYSASGGREKSPPRLTSVHRRHMPLVKPFTISPAVPADASFPIVRTHQHLVVFPSHRFRPLVIAADIPGTRAPPGL
jgi:hypothetical protein